MGRDGNPLVDRVELIDDDTINQCKLYYEDYWRRTSVSEKQFLSQARALKYFDYLLTYNKLQNFTQTAKVYSQNTGNARSYIMTAYQRVKRYIQIMESKV